MASEDLNKLAKKKEKLVRDTDTNCISDNAVHLGRENFRNDQEWLNRMATPREDQTWAHELAQRKERHTVRNSTNHIGRQRPAPNVQSVDMVAHTAVGVVNLADLYSKDAIANGIQKGLKLDPHKSLVNQLVSENKRVSVDEFSLWLEKTHLWRQSITEKVSKAEKRTKDELYPGEPRTQSHSKAIASRGLEREGTRLAQEMVEMDNDIHLRHSGIHTVSRGRRPGDLGDSQPNENGLDRSSPPRGEHESYDTERLRISLQDLESKREQYFGEGYHQKPDQRRQEATMGSPAGAPRGDKLTPTKIGMSATFSKVNPDADLASFEQAEEDYHEKEAMRKYYEMAVKVAKAPTVFDRMSARIEAFNLRASTERELERADIKHNSSNRHERERAIAFSGRKRSRGRTRSPHKSDDADGCTFTPSMNKTSEMLVEKMKDRGYESELSRSRSSSVPAHQQSTAKERFTAFLDSLDNKKSKGNNTKEKYEERRGRSPVAGDRSGGARSSSAPPGRPAWCIRSLKSEAIFDQFDSIETLALRAMKREKSAADRHTRSQSPTLKSCQPGKKATTSRAINTRRYSILSPPRLEHSFAKPVETNSKSATARLNALYAERGARDTGLSSTKGSSSSDEKGGHRRESITSVQNELLLARSKAFRGKTFEERTADSIEKYIVRRGVAELLALEGLTPGPVTYAGSHDLQDLLSRGEAQAGRKGYTFGMEKIR